MKDEVYVYTSVLETIKEDLDSYSSSVSEKDAEVGKKTLNVVDSYSGVDLSFLTEKLKAELNQFTLVKDNNVRYYATIDSVLNNYKKTSNKVSELFVDRKGE